MPTGSYKRTPENNLKMSLRLKGRKFNKEHIERLRKASTGKHPTKETREKMSRSAKLRIPSFTGKKHRLETRQKMSGPNHHNWKGGIYPLNRKIRHSYEYKLWKKSVLERDHHTCVFCGKSNSEIHADHIKPFAYYPELRFAIDNGRALCRECHRSTETYGSKKR